MPPVPGVLPPLPTIPPVSDVPPLPVEPPVSDEPPLPELMELPPLPEPPLTLPSLLPDENDQHEATRTPSDSARDTGTAG